MKLEGCCPRVTPSVSWPPPARRSSWCWSAMARPGPRSRRPPRRRMPGPDAGWWSLAGEMLDPRPAYAAADVVLGMGGSALRGMAFGKPLVVQGVRRLLEAAHPRIRAVVPGPGLGRHLSTTPTGASGGAARLTAILPVLLDDPATRARLGQVWPEPGDGAVQPGSRGRHPGGGLRSRHRRRRTARPRPSWPWMPLRTGSRRMVAQGQAALAALAGTVDIEDFNKVALGSEGNTIISDAEARAR